MPRIFRRGSPDILNFEVTMIGAPTIDLPALKLDD